MKFLRKNVERKGCGVLTAYNACHWAGIPLEYKDVSLAARAWCGFKNNGLKFKMLGKLLRELNVPHKLLRKGTPVNVALNALWDGHAVVFAYRELDATAGHAILLTPDFKIVNPDYKYKKWNDLFNDICASKVEFNAWVLEKV